MNRTGGTVASIIGLVAALYTGARGVGPLPPLGGLLDPVHGAWAAARYAELPRDATARVPHLVGPVEVRYDRRGVPHIFAATEDDAIRALGYVVARDRLFQLDAQTHAASGRLTEWAGARALPLDRQMRELGLPRGAERNFGALAAGGAERRAVEAYAEGVNAYIDGLTSSEWPVEYKLLGARPERWLAINTLHMLARMGYTLAYLKDERTRLAVAALVGDSAADALFPVDAPIQEPIQPNGSGAPRFDFRRLPPPGAPDTNAVRMAALLGAPPASDPEERQSFASNNWAVAPKRTRDGHALLAGDPHLDMTLPSIWYEAHLVVPGRLDVYGVTVPGAPGIVIGFTRDVAWSFTNTGADVLDFYRETVDDTVRPARYMVDSAWRPLERRVETYRGKAGEVLRVDTLLFTHRGPLSRSGSLWLSMRWLVTETAPSPSVFTDAARARTSREFLDDIAASFPVPAQNVITADRAGAIAIRSTGHYPIRPGNGDGLKIRDGSSSGNDWQGYWPLTRYPQAFEPAQGYLASANQQPIDPRARPGYLGYEAAYEPWRALQINRLLRADSAVTVDAMRRYQTDPGSARADLFVPYLVAAAASTAAQGKGTLVLDSAAAILKSWDRRYTRDNTQAVLFEATMRQLAGRTWDELAPNGKPRVATPTAEVYLELLRDSTSPWWDDRRTADRVEDRDAILSASLMAAYDSLARRFGSPEKGAWHWDRVYTTRMQHLLALPGFSAAGIPVQGGPGTLNPASAAGFGPSWRMVVEMGPEVRGWGAYPGGQSGNPVSPRYLDRLPLWREGALDTLFAPRDTAAISGTRVRARLRLVPGGGAP
jgi:penicillin amidase